MSLTFSPLLAFLCFLSVSGRFGTISCMRSRVQSGIDPRKFASDPWSLSFQIESPSPGTWLLISAPTYFVTTLKWRFLKEKLRTSLHYPASMISALWVGGKDRWRGEGDSQILTVFQTKKCHFPQPFLDLSKIYSRIQTWPTDIDDIYMYQENWSETDGNMCPHFYEQIFFLNEKHETFCVTHCLQLEMLHYY